MKTYFWKFLFDWTLSGVILFVYWLAFTILFPVLFIYAIYKEQHIDGAIGYVKKLWLSVTMNLIGSLGAIIFPLFSKDQLGWCDNHHYEDIQPRLYPSLSWFQTPDNSLWGDYGWQNEHCAGFYKTYWGKAAWLVRNKCYGFNWDYLGAVVAEPLTIVWEGEPRVDKNYPENVGKYFFAHTGKTFQWKKMWKIPFIEKTFIMKTGWLLDSYVSNPQLHLTQPKALFLFAPRIGKTKR